MRVLLPPEVVRRPAPLNLRPEEEQLFRHEYERRLEAAAIIELADAELLPNGFVLSGSRLVHESFASFPRGAQALKARGRVLQHRLLTLKTEVAAGLWITDEFSNGFFHWICDVLPRLEALGAEAVSRRTVLIPAMAAFPYAAPSLEPFRPGAVRSMAWSERIVCRDLLLAPPVAPTGNYRPSLMAAVRDRFQRHFGAAPGTRRLYVSRSEAPARRIRNEEQILPVLERHGFERIVSERLSLREQVRLVGSASVLLGNHGAGLTHMCWMWPGTTVVELRRAGDAANNCYYSLAAALDIRYRYLSCEPAEVRRSAHAGDVLVDPRLLDHELAQIG